MAFPLRPLSTAMFVILIVALAGVAPASPAVAAGATLRLSSTAVAANDRVTVDGYAFHAGDPAVVSITFSTPGGPQSIRAAAGVSADGHFTAAFFVPANVNPGLYAINATDLHRSAATRSIRVLPLVTIQPGTTPAAVTVGAYTGAYVRLNGFSARETVTVAASFPLYSGNTLVVTRTARTDAAGHVGNFFLGVPRGARRGSATVSATGSSSKRVGRSTIVVAYRPSLAVQESTVAPGASIGIVGHEFVASSRVRVSVTIPLTNGTREILTRDAGTDGNGNVSTTLGVPSGVQPGLYTISGTDLEAAVEAFARVRIATRPVLAVTPSTAVPGQTVAVTGSGFVPGQRVIIHATFPLLPRGTVVVTATAVAGAARTIYALLPVPAAAAPASVLVEAQAAAGNAAARLLVRARPTPVPTATPTLTPTPTPTATPTPTPTPVPHHSHGFGFRYVSLWYHPIRVGHWDHLVVQGKPHRHFGIWTTIVYPNGARTHFYATTDASGYWATDFRVPPHAVSGRSHDALIAFQLWRGRHSHRTFIEFRILR